MGSASGGSGSNPGASGGGSDPGNQPGYAGGGGNYGGNSFGGGLDSGSSLHPGPGGASSVYGGNQGGRDYIAAHTALFGSAATQAAGIGSQGNATGFAGSVADFLSKPLASFANGLEGWAKTNDWSEFEKMAGLAPGAFSGFSENLQKSIDYIGQHDFSDPSGYAQPKVVTTPQPKKTIVGYKSVPKTTYVTKAVTTKQPAAPDVPTTAQLQGQLPTFAAMDALGLSTGITPDVIHTSYEQVPTTTYERQPIYGSTTTKEIDAPGTIGQTISKATGLDSSGWGGGGGGYGSIGGSYDAGDYRDGGFHNSPQEGGYSGDGGFHGSTPGSGWGGDGGFHSTTPSIGEALGAGGAPGSFTDPANGGSWGGTAGPGRGETAGGAQVSPSVQGPAPAAAQGAAPGSYDFSNLDAAQATLAQGMQELFGPSIAQAAVSPASILASVGWGPRDEEYRSQPVTQPLAHPGQVNPNQGPESVGNVATVGAQQTYDPLSSLSPAQAALAGLGTFGNPAEHPAWPATPSPSITNATALAHPGQDMSDWGGFDGQGPLADRSLPGAGYDVADTIANAAGVPGVPGPVNVEPSFSDAQQALLGPGIEFGADPWGFGAPVMDQPTYANGYVSPLGGLIGFGPATGTMQNVDGLEFTPATSMTTMPSWMRPAGMTTDEIARQLAVLGMTEGTNPASMAATIQNAINRAQTGLWSGETNPAKIAVQPAQYEGMFPAVPGSTYPSTAKKASVEANYKAAMQAVLGAGTPEQLARAQAALDAAYAAMFGMSPDPTYGRTEYRSLWGLAPNSVVNSGGLMDPENPEGPGYVDVGGNRYNWSPGRNDKPPGRVGR